MPTKQSSSHLTARCKKVFKFARNDVGDNSFAGGIINMHRLQQFFHVLVKQDRLHCADQMLDFKFLESKTGSFSCLRLILPITHHAIGKKKAHPPTHAVDGPGLKHRKYLVFDLIARQHCTLLATTPKAVTSMAMFSTRLMPTPVRRSCRSGNAGTTSINSASTRGTTTSTFPRPWPGCGFYTQLKP